MSDCLCHYWSWQTAFDTLGRQAEAIVGSRSVAHGFGALGISFAVGDIRDARASDRGRRDYQSKRAKIAVQHHQLPASQQRLFSLSHTRIMGRERRVCASYLYIYVHQSPAPAASSYRLRIAIDGIDSV